MILESYPDPETVAAKAVDYLLAAADEAIKARGKFCVALAGGSTPRLVHRALAIDRRLTDEVLAKTHFFWGDERNVPPTDPDSNIRMALETLLAPRRVPRSNIHPPRAIGENLDAEALRYEIEIKKHAPLSPSGHPRLDLVFLGMGTDGHTASLFPGTRALDEKFRTFVANDVPQLATKRVTLTLGAINAAGTVLILVTGKDKAGMLDLVSPPTATPKPRYPVQLVRGNGSNVRLLADHAATSRMTTEQRRFYKIDF